MKEKPSKFDAVLSLVGGQITWNGEEMIYHDGQTEPTEDVIQTELDRLTDIWNGQEYARNRQAEYPSIESLVVGLYDTDDKSAIEAKRAAVKAKYPKPE